MASLVLVALLAAAGLAQPPQSRTAVFVGSTPSGEAMRTLLGIPREANVELIEWELTLDSETETDETDYLVTFEILQVTSGTSYVERMNHSCTGTAGCRLRPIESFTSVVTTAT